MKKRILKCNSFFCLAVAAWIVIPLTACSAAPSSEKEESVAVVNGESIEKRFYDSEVEQRMKQIMSQGKQPSDEDTRKLKEWVLNNLIHHTLLFQESKKLKISVPSEVLAEEWKKLHERFPDETQFQKALKDAHMTEAELKEKMGQGLAVKKLIDTEVMKNVVVTPKELEDFYTSQPEMFEQPEQVKASHILIKFDANADEKTKAAALEKIKGIQAELKKGADFAEMARTNSACPSSAKGGDLGFFARGQMVKPFEDAAFSMKPDEISDIVETPFGYHLIKTVDKKAKGKVPFDDIKDQLQGHLKQRKTNQAVEKYIEQLKAQAKIKTLIKL